MTCDKFIKKSIYNAFIFTAAYLPKHNKCVVKRKMLRRHPVVLKKTRNRADTRLNVTVEPEFILSLIGKFHSNPPSSFWGDAITRKIKDGRRGHVFRQIGFYFGTCTTRHWGEYSDQDLKKSPTSGLGGDAITRLSMENFTKFEPGTKQPNLSTDRNFFYTCTTRNWGEHNRHVSFESVE